MEPKTTWLGKVKDCGIGWTAVSWDPSTESHSTFSSPSETLIGMTKCHYLTRCDWEQGGSLEKKTLSLEPEKSWTRDDLHVKIDYLNFDLDVFSRKQHLIATKGPINTVKFLNVECDNWRKNNWKQIAKFQFNRSKHAASRESWSHICLLLFLVSFGTVLLKNCRGDPLMRHRSITVELLWGGRPVVVRSWLLLVTHRSVLEQNTEPQIAPDAQVGTLRGGSLLSVCEWMTERESA